MKMKKNTIFDFISEYYELQKTPQTKAEAYNRLKVLDRLEKQSKYYNAWNPAPYSKRRNRLVKMFWAFDSLGKKKARCGGDK